MEGVNQDYRFKFKTPTAEHIFVNTPIGYEEVEQSLERSRESDGIVLNITSNLKYIKDELTYLQSLRKTAGIDAICEVIVEKKNFNTYEVVARGFLDIGTLNIVKNTAEISYTDNSFDKVFRSQYNEKFEYNRITSVTGEDIPVPFVDKMIWKSREIYLRSVLDVREPYTESVTITALTPYICVPTKKIISSDELVVSTFPHTDSTYFVGYNSGDQTQVFCQAQQYFYLNNDQYKVLHIQIEIKMLFAFALGISGVNNQFIRFRIQKSLQNANGTFTNIQIYDLGEIFGSGSSAGQFQQMDFTSPVFDFPLEQGESLSLVLTIPDNIQGLSKQMTPQTHKITITEDSFFVPQEEDEIYVDCITLYNAFKRVVQIIDPSVKFQSNFIAANWNDVVLFSGETARHLLDIEGNKVTLGTFSFKELFEFAFTIAPISFTIKYTPAETVLMVEDINYFFDDAIGVDLGELQNISRTINTEKIFSRIEIGNRKSGKNEEVFGLQATNTVNTYSLPVTSQEKTYKATNDYRTDCNEMEMCYRKQYSLFPDTDTRYDKDIFAVDCLKAASGYYLVRTWEQDFAAVEGIYSINTAFNYRLTPMNCVIRHGKNFMMEFQNLAYALKSMQYLSTIGNVSLKTTITAEQLGENSNRLLSKFERATFTSDSVKGTAVFSEELRTEILKLVDGKENYYRTFTYKNRHGISEFGFMYSTKIGEEIEIELVTKYGI
tara:strand:- start:31164 stop:33323 length:2160 start_codon:yes stop_codon:yes gene_type:complete